MALYFDRDVEIVGVPRNISGLLAQRKELIAALEEAAEFIKSMDGGDMRTEHGWHSEEYLDAWLKARAAIEAAKKEEDNHG